MLTCFPSAPDDSLPRLSLLAELLAAKTLPGSLDLAARLLETLNRVMQSASPTQVDVSYIEQSLMSAVENAADKIVVRVGLELHVSLLTLSLGCPKYSAQCDQAGYPCRAYSR